MGAIVLNMLSVVLSSPHFKHFEHCALCFSFKHGRHGCAFFLYLAGCRGDTFLASGHGLTAHTSITSTGSSFFLSCNPSPDLQSQDGLRPFLQPKFTHAHQRAGSFSFPPWKSEKDDGTPYRGATALSFGGSGGEARGLSQLPDGALQYPVPGSMGPNAPGPGRGAWAPGLGPCVRARARGPCRLHRGSHCWKYTFLYVKLQLVQ